MSAAPTKDEALAMAVEAVELAMSLLKLSLSSSDRAELMATCHALLQEAENVKKSNGWPLSSTSSVSVPAAVEKTKKAPASTRIQTRAEQILLLKGSLFGSDKFVMWESAPSPSEFSLAPDGSLFEDAAKLDLSEFQNGILECWSRAEDALVPTSMKKYNGLPPGQSLLDIDGPASLLKMDMDLKVDLVQDAACDCSVVASLCAATALAEKGFPNIFASVIYPKANNRPVVSTNGKYIVRLNFNGSFRKVVIDDYLPVSRDHRTLHIVDRNNRTLLWPALLEKAYLKVRGGYDFPGSNCALDLWTLAGWIPEQVFTQDNEQPMADLWDRIFTSFRRGEVLVTAGTGKLDKRSEEHLGLESQHAYAVLNLKEEDHRKFFLIKNPWSKGTSWKGTISPPSMSASSPATGSRSSLLDEALDQNVNFPALVSLTNGQPGTFPRPNEQLTPGTFWIDMENLLQNFETIYLNWKPSLFTSRQDIHAAWNLATESPALLFSEQPQFMVKSKDGGPMWLLLCRHFTNDTLESAGLKDSTSLGKTGRLLPGYIGFYIYENNGVRVFEREGYCERSEIVSSPQTLLRFEARPNVSYAVVAFCEDSLSANYPFTLSAFGNSPIELERAFNKFVVNARVSSCWAQGTAGGSARSPTFGSNPQFRLVVRHAGSLVITLQEPSNAHNINVRLVHGKGKRIFVIRKRDVIGDSGDYTNSTAIAHVADVDPGTYTVIASTFEPDKYADFFLSVDSTVPIDLSELPRDGAGRVCRRLARATFNFGDNKVAAPLVPRRMIGVGVVASFCPGGASSLGGVRSTASESNVGSQAASNADGASNAGIRSPVRITIDVGRGSGRKILLASNNGEFTDEDGALRTDEVTLESRMLQANDMWLVLERLSGSSAASQEVYNVELRLDRETGLDVGAWRSWRDPLA
ncbi:hypothetical protein BDY21DRAFT_370259 [Lineolata rhizophorae]|uniref:Calpain catalytic domain-containing protein n=1 Tax=Lineolata rhizophorae TaxID=578093 RepID=A0A6A6P6C8_9PEZI|nr:hypothetical protein BDY21DRAFT_370259 [Lineolata rhizophorae]